MNRRWASRGNRRGGFSLIELMIVIAIIATLAAIIIPNTVRSRAQAKLASCKQNLKTIATAVNMYAVDNQGLLPGIPAGTSGAYENTIEVDRLGNWGVIPRYLKSAPQCAGVRINSYVFSVYKDNIYVRGGKGHAFMVQCALNDRHVYLGCAQSYPRWCENMMNNFGADGLSDRP